jgi:hypothetical protein
MADEDAESPASVPPEGGANPAQIAADLLDASTPSKVTDLGPALLDERATAATHAARVLAEVIHMKPDALAPLVDRFVHGILSKNKRVVQTSADALPAIAKVAPARVAKHLDRLRELYPEATLPAKDGLVRTFTALCLASVAYQKRLEPILCQALAETDGKTLQRWTEIVLPALKGEPHAAARAVVEERLHEIPKAPAQKIAAQLGIKLRVRR